jgi:hypothetical protein
VTLAIGLPLRRLPDPPALDPATMHRIWRVARVAADPTGSPDPTSAGSHLAVDPVFVTLYGPDSEGRTRPCVGAWHPTEAEPVLPVGEAIVRAARAAGKRLASRGHRDLEGVFVKVDLAGPARRVFLRAGWWLDLLVDPGNEGLMAKAGEARAWFLPGWAVERELSASRAAAEVDAEVGPGGGSLHRFRSTSFGGLDAPRPLVRGNVIVTEVSRATVSEALIQAGRYLARQVRHDGTYCYRYQSIVDRCAPDYNLLRHAGTTYALLQIHRSFPDPALLAGAERATRWLRRQVRPVTGDPSRAYLLEGTRAKLGAVGLTLIALVEREMALHDGRDRDLLRRLAAFVMSQQRSDGYLASYFAWDGQEVPPEQSIYYPGEALLGLVRLYGIDPEPQYLEAAQRTAHFLVERRWRWGGAEIYVPSDAWLAQALAELDALMPVDSLQNYAYRIVEVTERTTLSESEGAAIDLVGAPSTGPRVPTSTPAGSRIEAATAVWKLARRRGDEARAARLRDLSLASARFQLSQQYREGNDYYLPAPERARGGVRASPIDGEVRIDTVQHNATAWLGVLEMLP